MALTPPEPVSTFVASYTIGAELDRELAILRRPWVLAGSLPSDSRAEEYFDQA